jgi:hypothetical protein
MASDEMVYVLRPDRDTLARVTTSARIRGSWAEVDRVREGPAWYSGEHAAIALSWHLGLTTVHAVLQTSSDTIWIRAWSEGALVRELLYTGDAGWTTRTGKPLETEDRVRIASLTARRLLASPDGYDLLEAILGPSCGPEEVIERDDPWCDPMPACEHGYFERVLALRDGSLLAGGARAPGGWLSDTYLLRADRPAVRLQNGAPVGVLSENVIVTLSQIGPYKPDLYLFTAPDVEGRVEAIGKPKKLAAGAVVRVINGALFVREGEVVRRIDASGRASKVAPDAVPAIELAAEPTPAIPHDIRLPRGRIAFGADRVRWIDDDGNVQELAMPGLLAVGPTLGNSVLVKTDLGTWGVGWWSFRTPPTPGTADSALAALRRLDPASYGGSRG